VYEDARGAYENAAAMRVRKLAHKALPDSHVHLGWGEPADQLPAFASSASAGIVVMGAVSRSRLRRAFIGHTAGHVLDSLDCDVLIVKPAGFRSPVSIQSVHRLPRRNGPRARYIW
jgi:nucleotide-binding universal stress UspA family protein